ncbi:MAG: hypothetical protein ACKOBW_09520 [Planctomycetota bacterium]
MRPKVAQMLARHSDIRLTLGVYAHAELTDQTAAINRLPGMRGEQAEPRMAPVVARLSKSN